MEHLLKNQTVVLSFDEQLDVHTPHTYKVST